MLTCFYEKIILGYPKCVLLVLAVAIAFLGVQSRRLIIDASAENLILEDDEDLRTTRLINTRYGGQDYLIVTYTPKDDLLSDRSLADLKRLKEELGAVDGVESVVSILDVPLLESPPLPIRELVKNVQTLESPTVDREAARKELAGSPIYRNLLVSPDLKTTALQVNLREDQRYNDLLSRRNALREKERSGALTDEERVAYSEAAAALKQHRETARVRQHRLIVDVRSVIDRYRGEADLFLGGVSMIADDLITFVKKDLRVFGLGVMIFLMITLQLIFRQLRWVLIPLLCVSASAVVMIGILGLVGWEVTVISSNFISLQLIITMAITIHLIVRYRELLVVDPQAPQRQLVLDTVRFMAKPCLYAALTTIAGFASLILSNILPVITFGWMMGMGIAVSLALTFVIFPAVVVLLPKTVPNTSFKAQFPLTRYLARYTEIRGRRILLISGGLFLLSVAGITRLMVENSFINYFKDSTEIYRGMLVIDRQLGGTTPLDLVLTFDSSNSPEKESLVVAAAAAEDRDGDLFEEFEEEFEAAADDPKYWFTADKMDQIKKVHDYLKERPETGKVLSLGTMLEVGEKLNGGKPLDNFQLALIYSELPERFRKMILTPYVSVEHNQARFSIRVRDSEEGLRRNELLNTIRRDLSEKLDLQDDEAVLTGLLVLYNNMLQSLYRSQILTLGAVVAALMGMFLILFRSVWLAVIAIVPNLLSIGVVLGFMGWMRIPLDMMTITIAAISVGIAVDDTIHYIHRFRREFAKDRKYIATMHRCHETIGYAMYYTSVTIIIGFSILVLSSFIPTIYFGLLTGLAMLIALIAALTLLPQLIVFLRPFGPEVLPNHG